MSWIFVRSLRRWPKKTRYFLSSWTPGLFSLSLSLEKNEMKDNLFEPFPPFIVSYCTFLFIQDWKVFSCFCNSFVFQTTVRISKTSSCFLNSLPMSLQNVWLLDSRMIRLTLTKKEGQFQDKKREREQEVPWNSTKQEYDSFHYRRIRGKIMSHVSFLYSDQCDLVSTLTADL